MSSTTGIQTLLVNVVRPVYAYDATATLYTPKIELANVDTYSGNVVSVLRADISDANSNVYVGTLAGNTPATLTRGCFYTVALGVSAGNGISNVSNSVYLGYNAGNGATLASDVIAIGANSIGSGTRNIYLGTGTGGTGSSNILIGHGITSGTSSNVLQIGTTMYGNLSTKWVGIGTPTPINDFSNRFDVSGNSHIYGNLALNRTPGDRTLDVNGNFRASDAIGVLDFSNGVTSSTNGFVSSQGSSVVSDTANVSIGTLKRGLVLITVQSGSTNFDGRTVFVLDTAAPTVSNLSSNKSATTTVNFTSNSINISNTTGGSLTYDWSITYLPLP